MNRATADRAAFILLKELGADVDSDGMKETPARLIKFLEEACTPPPIGNLTTFQSEGYDEMIVQTGVQFYSLCEHHIAPFFGVGAIGYVPNGKIVGLSKLARVLEHFARRFQNQERITLQVANYLMEELKPKGVAVVLRARHMCMEMRGVKKPGAETTTSKLLGVFHDDEKARAEFMSLIGRDQ